MDVDGEDFQHLIVQNILFDYLNGRVRGFFEIYSIPKNVSGLYDNDDRVQVK